MILPFLPSPSHSWQGSPLSTSEYFCEKASFRAEVSENSRSREFSTRVSFIFSRSTTRNDFLESRSRLEIREWSYDNLDLVSPGESKKNNSQSHLEKLHLLSRVRVRFYINPNQLQCCTEGNHMI